MIKITNLILTLIHIQNIKAQSLKTIKVLPWTKVYDKKINCLTLWSKVEVTVTSLLYVTVHNVLMQALGLEKKVFHHTIIYDQ